MKNILAFGILLSLFAANGFCGQYEGTIKGYGVVVGSTTVTVLYVEISGSIKNVYVPNGSNGEGKAALALAIDALNNGRQILFFAEPDGDNLNILPGHFIRTKW